MYLPKRLQNNIEVTDEKQGANIVTKGLLTCCGSHEFNITYWGDLKSNLLGHKVLYPRSEGIILNAQCKNCGKEVQVFNSFTDGYDRYFEKSPSATLLPSSILKCFKCLKESFRIDVTFEYQSKEELIEDGIQDYENAFSWIWVSLTCTTCGNRYKNFINFETA